MFNICYHASDFLKYQTYSNLHASNSLYVAVNFSWVHYQCEKFTSLWEAQISLFVHKPPQQGLILIESHLQYNPVLQRW